MTEEKQHPYSDIINLPRPVSKKHPPLTMTQRAAQFKPFAAVKGHEEAIAKTLRDHEKQYE
jgi:hypothetical protein